MTRRIAEVNMFHLNSELEKLNKRADKLGVSKVSLQIVNTETVKLADGTVEIWHNVTVAGDRPTLNGWKLLAQLERIEDAGTIIKTIPGETLPERFRNVESTCEHCNINRYRRTTYIVQHVATGEFKQVGKSCLADFTGYGANPAGLLEFYESLGGLDEALIEAETRGYGGMNSPYCDVLEYLAYVAEAISKFGWQSSSYVRQYGGTSTAQLASNAFFAKPKFKAFTPSEKSCEEAKFALEWAKTTLHGKSGLSDFLHNLAIVTAQDYIHPKMFNILAALIPTYRKAKGDEMKKSNTTKETTSKESEFVGTVGEKVELTVTIESVLTVSSKFGISYLTKMRDTNGNAIVWFADSNMFDEFGYTPFKIKAKVKLHDEYKGLKQTTVYYVKLAN